MWPTQDMTNGRVRVNNPRTKILEKFKPACISMDVSFSWSDSFMYLPILDKKWLDKGIVLLSEGPIIPQLSIRLWVKSDGINIIPEGEIFVLLVPLETKVYMELTKDIMGPACWRGNLDKSSPSDEMTNWPKLNPHSQIIMDRFRNKGLVILITAMPETDYGARELEDHSGWGVGEVWGQATQLIMTNIMTSQLQERTDQVGQGLEEVMTGAQLAQWE
jgi:hypothetical protein